MEIILQTFGTAISRDMDGFVVTGKEGRKRIPTDRITSIQLGKGTQITSDAILLAVEKEIEVLFVDRSGSPEGRVWSPKYGSISTIRKGQLAFTASKDATAWIRAVIAKKILNQQAMLLTMQGEHNRVGNHEVDKAVSRLEEYLNKVRDMDDAFIADVGGTLRGWEGNASRIYFSTWNTFLPEEYRFGGRSQHPALDPVNALLNYGYGVLYGKIEGCLIKAGVDPYIGVLHRDVYNRPVLVYDVIEIYRAWVDYVVYSLAMQGMMTEDFCSRGDNGACWLENLGRRILIQSLNDYFDEQIEDKGLVRSRLTHLSLYAQHLAQTFKQYQ